jgi:hypothetical protein
VEDTGVAGGETVGEQGHCQTDGRQEGPIGSNDL